MIKSNLDAPTLDSIKDAPPQEVPTNFSECPQCGLIHPPLKPGERCPNIKMEFKNEKGDKIKIEIEEFLIMIKNIILSKTEGKIIQEEKIKKLFSDLVVESNHVIEKADLN